MRLAVVTDCVSQLAGGLFYSVRRLSQELQALGIEIQVFGVQDERTVEDLNAWLPLRPRVLPRRGPLFFGYAPDLQRTLHDFRPDAIQVHGLWKYTSIAARKAAAELKCPYIVNPHGMLDAWALRNSGWKKQLARIAYEGQHLQRAAAIRALHPFELESARAFGLLNPVCVIPNGVDLPRDRFGNDELSGAQRPTSACDVADGLRADQRILLYLGRLHPKKGLENLLIGWHRAERRLAGGRHSNGWTLAIAGFGSTAYEARLRSRVEQLSLNKSVVFVGPKFGEAKTACMKRCDAFVLPSLSEGLPMAVLEAWAFGKPVLMTPECNLPEGYAAGAAIPIDSDPNSITHRICHLREMSESERTQIGMRGNMLVRERFNWTEIARKMHGVLEWLLGSGSVPDCVELD